MPKILKPTAKDDEVFHLYCKIRNPDEVRLLQRVSADLGHPNNSALIYLLARHYALTNEVQL